MTTALSLILAIMLSIGGSPAGVPGDTGIQAPVNISPNINRIFEDYTQKTASRADSKKIIEIHLINNPKTQIKLSFQLCLKEKLYLRGYIDSMNLYQAFNMNPINFTDPFGLLTQEQRRMVGSQVFRLIMAPNEERKLAALNALQAYRAEFGELTQEDIADVFGENDYVLAATNVDVQTMLNYAGAKIALGIADLSTSYNPSYSSRYGEMNARTEIDPQGGMINLYNSVVGSRQRIQRMSFGKRQGLWVNEALTNQNYEEVLAESMYKEQQSRIFAFALTSMVSTLAARTNIMRYLKRPNQVGKMGEREVGNIGQKIKINVNGRNRIPDGLTKTTLSEVKNVKSLSFRTQLRDFCDYAKANNLKFELYVRPSTQLTGTLIDAIQRGDIFILFIPGAK